MHHPETNPHFHRPFQPHFQDQPTHQSSPPGFQFHPEDNHGRPLGSTVVPKGRHGQRPRTIRLRDDQYGLPPSTMALPEGYHGQSPSSMTLPEGNHGQPPQSVTLPESHHGIPPLSTGLPEGQYSSPFYPTKLHPDHREGLRPSRQQRRERRSEQPDSSTQRQERRSRTLWLHMPVQRQTNPFIWFTAVFCAIFWVVVIVGGLAVLIIYLIFRPKSPRFDISTATLNAAYLDMGYLLNADTTLLANFTNPNHKVSVDFSYNIINLYYGKTLISTQYIEPFSAAKTESKFANIHMVSSQVRLPIVEAQRLKKQMEKNDVVLDVRGFFRARSNFGGLLRYSYWLYSHCRLELAGSPSGVLVSSKCRTKR